MGILILHAACSSKEHGLGYGQLLCLRLLNTKLLASQKEVRKLKLCWLCPTEGLPTQEASEDKIPSRNPPATQSSMMEQQTCNVMCTTAP